MPEHRIIYVYEMSFKNEKLSASLATVQFLGTGTQTHMIFTEQAALVGGAMQDVSGSQVAKLVLTG